MKASLQPKPMYCSRDYYYSSKSSLVYILVYPLVYKIRKLFFFTSFENVSPLILIEIFYRDF